MSQTQTANLTLVISGQPVTVPNSLQNSSSLTISYTPQNTTQSYSVSVEGVTLASGESTVLDTLTNQTGNIVARSISLSSVLFDSYRIIGTWSGAAQQFSVAVAMVSTGAGAPYSSSLDIAVIHSV